MTASEQPKYALSIKMESNLLIKTETSWLRLNSFRWDWDCQRADHQPLDFRMGELTLPTAELIAEAQADGSRTIHRYPLIVLRVVRIELGARVAEILSEELH
jgi:hypothetical protein